MANLPPEMPTEEDLPPPGSGASGLRYFLWFLVALAAVVGLALALGEKPSGDAGQIPANYANSVGGAFELTAPDGSTVTEQTLEGKPFAIFFGFTRCPDVCPTTLSRLAQLRQRMGEDGDKFRIVFVSVDAGRDTPETVGNYVDLFGTPILGLTGTQSQIDTIVKAYHVFYEKVPVEGGDYTIDHTAGVYLMDRDGKLQSIIDHHEEAETSLAKLQRLVA